jgi:hypothetical protein
MKLSCRASFWLVPLVMLPTLLSCNNAPFGRKPGAPPVAFHYRNAQLPGKGLVAGIENTSTSETLSEFVVKVSSKDGPR